MYKLNGRYVGSCRGRLWIEAKQTWSHGRPQNDRRHSSLKNIFAMWILLRWRRLGLIQPLQRGPSGQREAGLWQHQHPRTSEGSDTVFYVFPVFLHRKLDINIGLRIWVRMRLRKKLILCYISYTGTYTYLDVLPGTMFCLINYHRYMLLPVS